MTTADKLQSPNIAPAANLISPTVSSVPATESEPQLRVRNRVQNKQHCGADEEKQQLKREDL